MEVTWKTCSHCGAKSLAVFRGGSRISQMGMGPQPLNLGQKPKIFAENCMKMKEIDPPMVFFFQKLEQMVVVEVQVYKSMMRRTVHTV